MPKFNLYPDWTTPASDDTTAIWSAADLAVQQGTLLQLANFLAGLAKENVTVTAIDGSLTLTTEQMVVVNTNSNVSITIPLSSLNTGRTYYIVNSGSGTTTILPTDTDTISGAASTTLAQNAAATLRADGLGHWWVF